MAERTLNELSREVPEEELRFIERLLYNEFDTKYQQLQDNAATEEEVLAVESALETVTMLRETFEDVSEGRREATANAVRDTGAV